MSRRHPDTLPSAHRHPLSPASVISRRADRRARRGLSRALDAPGKTKPRPRNPERGGDDRLEYGKTHSFTGQVLILPTTLPWHPSIRVRTPAYYESGSVTGADATLRDDGCSYGDVLDLVRGYLVWSA